MKLTHRPLGHSLVHLLVLSHRLLIRRTGSALHTSLACSFIHSLAHSLALEHMGKRSMSMNRTRSFHAVSTHCAVLLPNVDALVSKGRGGTD